MIHCLKHAQLILLKQGEYLWRNVKMGDNALAVIASEVLRKKHWPGCGQIPTRTNYGLFNFYVILPLPQICALELFKGWFCQYKVRSRTVVCCCSSVVSGLSETPDG